MSLVSNAIAHSAKSTHAGLMWSRLQEIAAEKAKLKAEAHQELMERKAEEWEYSGGVEAYLQQLEERRQYREAVNKHEKAGGFVYKSKGKGNIRKFADIEDGWAHLVSVPPFTASNSSFNGEDKTTNGTPSTNWADIMDEEDEMPISTAMNSVGGTSWYAQQLPPKSWKQAVMG